MPQCQCYYSNGEQCKNECFKNLKYCSKHRYYGKYKNSTDNEVGRSRNSFAPNIYNETDNDEPIQETTRIPVPTIQERSNHNNDYIADNPYNRWFINECVSKSNPAPVAKSSSYADYLPILMMFLPLLKNILGTQEALNLFKSFKNLKGIKEDSKENFKTDNIRTTDGADIIPIIPTEVSNLQNRDSTTDIKEHKG